MLVRHVTKKLLNEYLDQNKRSKLLTIFLKRLGYSNIEDHIRISDYKISIPFFFVYHIPDGRLLIHRDITHMAKSYNLEEWDVILIILDILNKYIDKPNIKNTLWGGNMGFNYMKYKDAIKESHKNNNSDTFLKNIKNRLISKFFNDNDAILIGPKRISVINLFTFWKEPGQLFVQYPLIYELKFKYGLSSSESIKILKSVIKDLANIDGDIIIRDVEWSNKSGKFYSNFDDIKLSSVQEQYHIDNHSFCDTLTFNSFEHALSLINYDNLSPKQKIKLDDIRKKYCEDMKNLYKDVPKNGGLKGATGDSKNDFIDEYVHQLQGLICYPNQKL